MKSRSLLANIVALSSLFFFFCEMWQSPVDSGSDQGNVSVMIQLDRIGRLAKSLQTNEIQLVRLAITLSAEGETPIFDTIPICGNNGYTAGKTYANLASLKVWTVSAESYDSVGTRIHSGSQTFTVEPKRTARVTLNLSASYSMLVANFFPIRDSVTRCVLLIDQVEKANLSFPKQTRLGDTIKLSYDYLSTGSQHSIRLNAFGEMWGIDTLLYSGDTTISVAPGEDKSYSVLLKWVGPSTPPPGQAVLTVVVGHIGTVAINGNLGANSVVAHWKFDEGTGKVLTDYSGNENHGAIYGATWTTGLSEGALFLDGDSDYVIVPHNAMFTSMKAITVEAWIRPTSYGIDPEWYNIVNKSSVSQGQAWNMTMQKSRGHKIQFEIRDSRGNGTTIYMTSDLSLNAWNYLVGTWDGDSIRVYRNGVLENTKPCAVTAVNPTTCPVYIGRGDGGYRAYPHGKMDEIRILNYALTPAEVLARYQSFSIPAN